MWELFPPFSAVVANFIQFPTSCQFPIDGDNLEIIFLQIIEKKPACFWIIKMSILISNLLPFYLFIFFFFGVCVSWQQRYTSRHIWPRVSQSRWWAEAKKMGGGECSAVWKNLSLIRAEGKQINYTTTYTHTQHLKYALHVPAPTHTSHTWVDTGGPG